MHKKCNKCKNLQTTADCHTDGEVLQPYLAASLTLAQQQLWHRLRDSVFLLNLAQSKYKSLPVETASQRRSFTAVQDNVATDLTVLKCMMNLMRARYSLEDFGAGLHRIWYLPSHVGMASTMAVFPTAHCTVVHTDKQETPIKYYLKVMH